MRQILIKRYLGFTVGTIPANAESKLSHLICGNACWQTERTSHSNFAYQVTAKFGSLRVVWLPLRCFADFHLRQRGTAA
jgi:hypothetical protein